MEQNIKFIKAGLWLVVAAAAVTLILALGLKSLATEPPPVAPLPAETEAPAELPLVIVSRRGDRLQAATEAEVAEWQYLGPLLQPVCDSAFFVVSAQSIRSGMEIRLQDTDAGRYYCFRALLSDELYAYGLHWVEQASLSLAIEQDLNVDNQRVMRLVASRPLTEQQAFGPLAPSEACVSELFETDDRELSSAETIIVGAVESLPATGETIGSYCFRGREADGLWIYTSRFPSAPPSPAWNWQEESDGRLRLDVGTFSGSDGEHIVRPSGAITCFMEDFSDRGHVRPGNVIELAQQEAEAFYCFRIKDTGNTYHYSGYPPADS